MSKFVVKQSKTGFVFHLKANNGEIVANSEVYNTKDACKKGIESVKTTAPEAAVEDQTKDGYTAEKNPKFEIYLDKKGEYRFRLKASNGQIVVTGEGYKALKNCMNGIESVKKNAPIAALEDQTVENFEVQKNPKFEIYKDKAGEFRFRLKATNGQIIAVGEGYKALAGCKNGIESIRKNAPEAEIVKEAD